MLTTDVRIDAHIITDKVVYRPDDVIFIEVLLFEAFNKTPLDSQYFFHNFVPQSYQLEIYDQSDQKIYSSSAYATNSTLSFTYKVPTNASGGEYIIRVYNRLTSVTQRLIRIRSYNRQELIITHNFDKQSYFPGDIVNGQINVSLTNGQALQESPKFTYNADFGVSTFEAQSQLEVSMLTGVGNFSFNIDPNTTQLVNTISFTVIYQNVVQVYQASFIVGNVSNLIIDFSPETNNYVYQVPNKIYFQAFSNEARTVIVDFQNASLKSQVFLPQSECLDQNQNSNTLINSIFKGYPMPDILQNQTIDTILANSVSTQHRGKGVFPFIPIPYVRYYLEIDLGNGNNVAIDLPMSQNISISNNKMTDTIISNLNGTILFPLIDQVCLVYANDNEISFTIVNEDKILENEEDLKIQLMTNSQMSPNNRYILTIQQKEKYLYAAPYFFNPQNDYQVSIASDLFKLINGGVLQLNLIQINSLYVNSLQKDIDRYDLQQLISLNYPTPLFINKGEILFFVKPSKFLQIQIKTEKDNYQPGDLVNFQINVTKLINQTLPDENLYVSLYVTDNNVFNQIEDQDQPASLPALVYLENEIKKQQEGLIFKYANEYLSHLYQSPQLMSPNLSNDKNLVLLLGVQSWRYCYFFYNNILRTGIVLYSMNFQDKIAFENVFSYPFLEKGFSGGVTNQTFPPSSNEGGGGSASSARPTGSSAASGSGSGQGSGTGSSSISQPQQNVSTSGNNNNNVISLTPPKLSESNQSLTNALNFLSLSIKTSDYMQNITKNTRLYQHQLRQNYLNSISIDKTETQLYASSIKIPLNRIINIDNTQYITGQIQGSFNLSDLITSFRFSVNAYSSSGALGFSQIEFQSTKKVYITFNIPQDFTVGDTINVDVIVWNTDLNKTIQLNISDIGFIADQKIINIQPINNSFVQLNESQDFTTFSLQALKISENIPITFYFNGTDQDGNNIFDIATNFLSIVPKGFQQVISQGGFIGIQYNNSNQSLNNIPDKVIFNVTLPQSAEKNGIQFDGKILISNYAFLTEAVQSLIREPHGCFEQLSATTYPLVMALQYLLSLQQRTRLITDYISEIRGLLNIGYQRLISYKTHEHGYEWFGRSPASEPLSAYGLMQFLEMQIAYEGLVDQNMVDELISWLSNRRNGQGSYLLNPNAPDHLSRAPQNITDAYITWILSINKNVRKLLNLDIEIQYLVNLADQSIQQQNIDTYFLALISSILYNVNRISDARIYADIISNQQNKQTGKVGGSVFTITMSKGINRDIETTALSALMWLNDDTKYALNIQLAINYIVSQVKIGQYGTTQATILSLKAITKYMIKFLDINGNGTFSLRVNGQIAQQVDFSQDLTSSIVFNISDFINNHTEDIFFPGNNIIFSLSIDNYIENQYQFLLLQPIGNGFKLGYSMNLIYYDIAPQSSNTTSLQFNISQNQTNSSLGNKESTGQLFSYNLALSNKNETEGLLMVVAIFRLPSCLEINFNALDQLQSNNIVDFYEVRNFNTEIVFYWTELGPLEQKEISLSLAQVFDGFCFQQPSVAYVYYNKDEPVYWIF